MDNEAYNAKRREKYAQQREGATRYGAEYCEAFADKQSRDRLPPEDREKRRQLQLHWASVPWNGSRKSIENQWWLRVWDG